MMKKKFTKTYLEYRINKFFKKRKNFKKILVRFLL